MNDRLADQQLRRRGDRRARAELAARYLPLARALAMRYRHSREPIEDLVQAASLGLVKAIDRWDPDRGTAFASYAVPTILGEIRRHFRDSTWLIKPPRSTQELALRVTRTRDALWGALGREPTVGELATALEHSPEAVLDAVTASEGQKALSLDAPVGDPDDGVTHLDVLGRADEAFAVAEARVLAGDLVRVLDRRAREVLRLRFELDLHQREIGELIGVSQIHVSRILRDALATLHDHAIGIAPASRAAAA
jgi:RNA polymerase sigma-B factor